MQIRKEPSESKENFMYRLFNDFGDTEVAFAYNYKKDGETRYSKWVKYSELMQLEPEDFIKSCFPLKISRQNFIQKACHRTILDVEILFDIDDCTEKIGGEVIWVYDSVLDKAITIFEELRSLGKCPVLYSTGSRGCHISVVEPKLKFMNYLDRRKFKEQILSYYGAELLKACKSSIAMEGCEHWKSGKIKKEVTI